MSKRRCRQIDSVEGPTLVCDRDSLSVVDSLSCDVPLLLESQAVLLIAWMQLVSSQACQYFCHFTKNSSSPWREPQDSSFHEDKGPYLRPELTSHSRLGANRADAVLFIIIANFAKRVPSASVYGCPALL
jgi:hypothetical protein